MARKPICPLTLERYARKYPTSLTNGLWAVATAEQPYIRLQCDAVTATDCAGLYSKRDALQVLNTLLRQRYAVGVGHWGAFLISEVSEG